MTASARSALDRLTTLANYPRKYTGGIPYPPPLYPPTTLAKGTGYTHDFCPHNSLYAAVWGFHVYNGSSIDGSLEMIGKLSDNELKRRIVYLRLLGDCDVTVTRVVRSRMDYLVTGIMGVVL